MSRALIVTYHAIEHGPPPLCVDPELFRAHIDAVLSAGARVVTISELVTELSAPTSAERLVALTFDDGFASVVHNAAPVLAAHGLTATVFCVPGHLGGRNDWESDPPGGFDGPLAGASDIRTLVAAGLEIGSHGWAHLPVSHASGPALEEEIAQSKEALERLSGTEVRSYAYPYGALPHPEARRLVERTYGSACTTRVAFVDERSDMYTLPRVDAHYLRHPTLFRKALAGSLGSYLAARRLGSRARRSFHKDFVKT